MDCIADESCAFICVACSSFFFAVSSTSACFSFSYFSTMRYLSSSLSIVFSNSACCCISNSSNCSSSISAEFSSAMAFFNSSFVCSCSAILCISALMRSSAMASAFSFSCVSSSVCLSTINWLRIARPSSVRFFSVSRRFFSSSISRLPANCISTSSRSPASLINDALKSSICCLMAFSFSSDAFKASCRAFSASSWAFLCSSNRFIYSW